MNETQGASTMDWSQVLTIIGALVGTCLYFKRETDKQIAVMRQNIAATNELLKEMKDEMKDFHGRLCALEERIPKKHIFIKE